MVRPEPAYQRHNGKCRECGKSHTYYDSVKLHPDHDVCPECEEAAKAVSNARTY